MIFINILSFIHLSNLNPRRVVSRILWEDKSIWIRIILCRGDKRACRPHLYPPCKTSKKWGEVGWGGHNWWCGLKPWFTSQNKKRVGQDGPADTGPLKLKITKNHVNVRIRKSSQKRGGEGRTYYKAQV